jgi:non-heme chloroperoxidase
MRVRFNSVRLATGPRLHYAESGDASGRPVVFLHGWPDSWFSFSRVLPLLPSTLHAFVPDQRGYGESDRPAVGYSIEHYAADAAAFLDALSIERAAFVGHSFGSFVTRCVALNHPSRVTRMALIGTAASALSPITREVQSAVRDLPDPVPFEFAREFQAGTAHAPMPEAFFQRVVTESLKLPARLWREAFDAVLAYDDADRIGQIKVPTLLLWGEHDSLFSRESQTRLLATIQGATLRVYSETGHCPNWERPELVAADLQTFLQAT